MKKVILLLSIFAMSASALHAQQARIDMDVIIGKRAPAPNEIKLMNREEAAHPNITKAMHDIEKSQKALNNAPDDFGGHKAQAEADLHQAWVSLRKALYYRLYVDSH